MVIERFNVASLESGRSVVVVVVALIVAVAIAAAVIFKCNIPSSHKYRTAIRHSYRDMDHMSKVLELVNMIIR
jgi:hypothetical protein